MSQILGSERALFDRHIIEANLIMYDFEITKEEDAPGATKLIGTGKVTVTYKPTGIARHYPDGVFPPPHVEFDRELKTDLFKT
ncbi:MAG: hypothetical protein ACE1Z4_00125 [Gammaproteobacteria bacterium]